MKKNKTNQLMIMPTLSNNSHELFHSNLWAWLIKNDHNFVKVFFKDFDVNKFKDVYREKDNTDLAIEDTEGNYYIIENKFKAIPEEKQLIKYRDKLNRKYKNNNKYLLTYLIDSKIKINGWTTLKYEELIKRIKKRLKKDKNNKAIKKYKLLLNEYCVYVGEIVKKVKSDKFVKSKYYYRYRAIPKEILDDPLKVIYLKHKCEHLRLFIDKKLKELFIKFSDKGYQLKSYSDYNNDKTTLTYRVQLDGLEELKKHTAIEIQIEGGQYRYMARTIGNDEFKAEKEVFKIFNGTKFFNENYNKINNPLIHGKKSSMTGQKGRKSCGYKGEINNTIAIYQYYDLKAKTSYREIAKNIEMDLNKYVYKNLNNKKIKKFLNK